MRGASLSAAKAAARVADHPLVLGKLILDQEGIVPDEGGCSGFCRLVFDVHERFRISGFIIWAPVAPALLGAKRRVSGIAIRRRERQAQCAQMHRNRKTALLTIPADYHAVRDRACGPDM